MSRVVEKTVKSLQYILVIDCCVAATRLFRMGAHTGDYASLTPVCFCITDRYAAFEVRLLRRTLTWASVRNAAHEIKLRNVSAERVVKRKYGMTICSRVDYFSAFRAWQILVVHTTLVMRRSSPHLYR